jgi:hypothetical protein
MSDELINRHMLAVNIIQASMHFLFSCLKINSNLAQVTCKRGSAKHSVKHDFAFVHKHAIFRHPLNKNSMTDQTEILHSL